MKKLFLFALLFSPLLFGQQKQPVSSLQEDCGVTFAFTAQSSGAQASGTVTVGSTGTTSVIDNRQAGCLDWLVTYSTTTTVTGISLTFQTATDVAGVPTTWSNYPGTIISGINPNTVVTTGGAVTETTGPKYPFLRMNLTSLTGTGTVQGKLYGWKRRPTYVTILSGGGCPGTVATPCVVIGPTPAGSAPTTAPVLVSGQTGNAAAPGTIQTLHVDANGNQIVVGPAATGAAVSGAPVYISGIDTAGNVRPPLYTTGGLAPIGVTGNGADGVANSVGGFTSCLTGFTCFQEIWPLFFNGTTWDRQWICNQSAPFNLSGSGSTQIIAASGSTVIRICHIDFLTTAAVNVKLVSGTGANCVTGPADLTGLYTGAGAFSFAMDYQPTAALRGPASGAVCVNQSGAVTTGGTVIYAQY